LEGDQPSVLMASAKWWPLSARLAIALVHRGCRVSALCPAGHPLTHVKGLDQVRRYRGIDSLNSLRQTLLDLRSEIVVPCDDGVVAQLHALHAQEPRLRAVIERSLGAGESFSIVSSRYNLLTTAMELGIAVPKTVKVRGAEDLVDWHKHETSGVLKIDGESGGNGVRVCASLDESLAAWQELSSPSSSATAWKRLAIDRDPLAWWERTHQTTREITMQRFVKGRPANSMLACRSGELLSLVSVAVIAADGPTGAAIIVQRITSEPLKEIAQRLIKPLQLSGFYGLDFMIEEKTGTPYLIEMNPRCTQLGHLEFPNQCSLAGSLVAALRGEPSPLAENPVPVEKIAFFPQALATPGAHALHTDVSYLDVPRDQPDLERELRMAPWPQRRWLAHLYHALRPLQRSTPVEFGNLGSPIEAEDIFPNVGDKPIPATEL
jgi:hypothetical protein